MQVHAATFDGGEVKLGAYRVDPSLLNKVSAFTPLQVQSAAPTGYRSDGWLKASITARIRTSRQSAIFA